MSKKPLRLFSWYPELEHVKEPIDKLKLSPKEKETQYKSPLHALVGYRKMPVQSLSKCFWSSLTIHNDTGNIWTHLLPGLYFLYLAASTNRELADLELNYEDRAVLVGYLLFATVTWFFSAAYHTFRAHSVAAYNFCLMCDLRGIILLLCGANMLCISQTMKYFTFWRHFYHGINFTVLICLFLWIPHMVKHRLSKQRTLYFSIYTIIGLFAWCHKMYFLLHDNQHILPVIKNYVDHYHSGWAHLISILTTYAIAGAGMVIRNLKYPERGFPYVFDIICSSHQIFHVVTAFGAYFSYKGLIDLMRSGAFPHHSS
ncbi:adiponectin receptor [Acrasis kona]|uniref:Adiponectin receptor n=1 Tax=Acrasis kona TaxID=1008807 RepID=A0AAW2YMB3_9EUKA